MPYNTNMQLLRYPALRRYIMGQVGLYGFLLVCTIILPVGTIVNDGLSYYGVHLATIIPYSLSLLLCSGFTMATGRALTRAGRTFRPFVFASYLFAVLMLGVLATPHTLNQAFSIAHVLIGNTLFLGQFILIIWAVFKFQRDSLNFLLLGLLIVISAVAFLSLLQLLPWLFETQISFQLTFGILLVRILYTQLSLSATQPPTSAS